MDEPSTSYSALPTSSWPMEPWSHKSLPAMRRFIDSQIMLACSKQRCTFKEIDAEFMLYRLDQAPRLGSRYEHYHRDVRTTLIAKATEWLRSKPGRAGATLYGHQLAEYYLELLQLHFEPEKKADYRQRYVRLVQGNVAPTAYLQEALTYKPYLGISDFEFSTNWVRRLDPTVNERVLSKWGLVPHDEWFPHLSAIATDAEVAWNNQRFAAASAVSTQPAVAPTTGPPPSSSAAAAQPSKSARPSSSTSTPQGASTGSSKSSRAKYWCSKHGWNASHITEECKHGQAVLASTGASHSVDQLKGLFEQFLAMSGYAPAGAAAVTPPAPATKWQTDHAMRPGQQQSPQQQQGAGGGAGEQHNRCDYCSRLHGGVCFIRNPELAPPNYRAPSGVLQAAFHNNMQAYRAKQAAQPAQHAQPAQQVQQPAVAATAQVYDNYSEEIYAPGYPALITCHEAICCEQQATGGMSLKGLGAACATLKQQQVPVTFTPAPIPDIEFSAPKVQRKPVPATEGGINRLTGTFTLEIPFTLDHGRDFADQLRTKMLSVLGLSADSCAVQPPEHLKAQLQPAAQQAHPAFVNCSSFCSATDAELGGGMQQQQLIIAAQRVALLHGRSVARFLFGAQGSKHQRQLGCGQRQRGPRQRVALRHGRSLARFLFGAQGSKHQRQLGCGQRQRGPRQRVALRHGLSLARFLFGAQGSKRQRQSGAQRTP
ncbi:hypothetical protein PLESTF_000133000 [Pleodorina starrii]|nr:hypothetical protein PLESTF_000133000 [Pleodorina starrii]